MSYFSRLRAASAGAAPREATGALSPAPAAPTPVVPLEEQVSAATPSRELAWNDPPAEDAAPLPSVTAPRREVAPASGARTPSYFARPTEPQPQTPRARSRARPQPSEPDDPYATEALPVDTPPAKAQPRLPFERALERARRWVNEAAAPEPQPAAGPPRLPAHSRLEGPPLEAAQAQFEPPQLRPPAVPATAPEVTEAAADWSLSIDSLSITLETPAAPTNPAAARAPIPTAPRPQRVAPRPSARAWLLRHRIGSF
jgi:hypothetical protein